MGGQHSKRDIEIIREMNYEQAAIRALQRPITGETLEQIASDCGVTRRQMYNWSKESQWKEIQQRYLKESSADILTPMIPKVLSKLAERAAAGSSIQWTTLFLTVTGILQPTNQASTVQILNNVQAGETKSDNRTSEEIESSIDELKRQLDDIIDIKPNNSN